MYNCSTYLYIIIDLVHCILYYNKRYANTWIGCVVDNI